ncbi:MAG: glycoside hydrolase family 3 N-terminal domain-containing protein [Gemmatimonadales bacterium]
MRPAAARSPVVRAAAAAAVVLAITGCGGAPAYRDPSLPVARRVADLLGRMTPEEKFWQLFAVPVDPATPATRFPHGIYGLQVRLDTAPSGRAVAERINELQRHFVEETRLGIPFIAFEEALHGLVQPRATVFPQAIALAATWDRGLVERVAGVITAETRSRGFRQVLSPMLNVATDVRWGRVEESYGEDPVLASEMAAGFVGPFERAGVATTPKHFIANVGDGGRDSYPIDLDRRLLAELHLPPFRAALGAGARSVMAAYNSVDGSPASASRWLLRDLLKRDWRFGGVVISDAGGTGGANVLHGTSPDYPTSGRLAVEAGLDVIFQTSVDHAALFEGPFLDGTADARAVDSAVARVLALKFELGLFDHPYVAVDSVREASAPGHRELARDAARASLTLLANDGTLPLAAGPRRIALIGPDAVEARLGGYSGPGNAPVTLAAGLRTALPNATIEYLPGPGRDAAAPTTVPAEALGGGLDAEYFTGIVPEGTPAVRRSDRRIDFNWAFAPPDSAVPFGWYSVRWTGLLTSPTTGPVQLGVDADDGFRLFIDGRLVLDRWRRASGGLRNAVVRLERGKPVPIRLEYHQPIGPGRIRLVWDQRPDNRIPGGGPDGAIAAAVAAARRAQVAIIAAGIDEGEFADRASLRLPGRQEDLIRAVAATGTPTVVVLTGGSAVTMTDWIDRVGAVLVVWYGGDEGGTAVAEALAGRINPAGRLPISFPVSEGQLPLSYWHKPTGRGDDYRDLTGKPRFPFGHGLSYTSFSYRDLAVSPDTIGPGDSVTVSLTVRNDGPRDGDEVVQVYLHDDLASVTRPVQALAAFARVAIPAGTERRVNVVLPAERFRLLDRELREVLEPGTFSVLIGASAADIRLRGRVTAR